MKYLKIIALLLICTGTVNAQTIEYRTALQKFQEHYNSGDVDSAFELLGPSMQEAIPLETLSRMFERLDKTLGKFQSFKFDSNQDKTQIYIASFEKGEQKVRMFLGAENKIIGLLFRPVDDVAKATPKFERNITKLQLPFKDEWFVVWGGDNKAQNYHVVDQAQRRAFDILVLGKNNKTYERSGTRNEDYWAFGKPLYAVCDALVLEAADGNPDNKPGDRGKGNKLGNYVLLKTANDEFIYYAHFENGTVKVKAGDAVKQGQYLGNCGNSGNSSEAHLHLHMQDGPDIDLGVGVQMYFEKLKVGGETKNDYSPVRLDRISRPKN